MRVCVRERQRERERERECAEKIVLVVACTGFSQMLEITEEERWGAGVETQKNVRGEVGGWGRVPFNETYAPLLSTIYDGA